MNKYNVTLQAAINVRVSAVEAAMPQEAIQAAIDKIDLYSLLEQEQPTQEVDFMEYAEEVREALVDVVGDEQYDESRWFIWHNGQWIPCRPIGSKSFGCWTIRPKRFARSWATPSPAR